MGRRVTLLAVLVAALAFAGTASAQNFIVLYNQQVVSAGAAKTIGQAGGSLVYSYDQIGVAIASSSSPTFRADLLKRDSSIENVAATGGFATRLDDVESAAGPASLPNTPAPGSDNLSSLQWDMVQIKAPEARAITGGSPSVLVGDIDTGLDYTHPDLAPNVDFANSVSCIGGVPDTRPAMWNDDFGHGTHTAGTIAAAKNGIGIVGVAPNVRIAGIKAGDADGYFFPEAVICSFVWAGTHHVDVTNNSYFADPYLFNCRNDATQRAIWIAEQRAIRFAMSRGVTVVSAEGNESEDLSHPTMDITSPDFPPGSEEERTVTNACLVIPAEIPGVIGVSATGSYLQGTNAGQYPDNLKSFYSSFGISSVDVAAPGGDSRYGTPPFTGVAGRVLSTWPAALIANCLPSRRVFDAGAPGALWCYQQGTSMASPHAAGVAALIVSRYGSASNPNGKLAPGQVEAILEATADPQACPVTLPTGYDAVVGTQSGAAQTCAGGPGHNSWYGAGQVDALSAVTR
jgi:subtilisin family serine protease